MKRINRFRAPEYLRPQFERKGCMNQLIPDAKKKSDENRKRIPEEQSGIS